MDRKEIAPGVPSTRAKSWRRDDRKRSSRVNSRLDRYIKVPISIAEAAIAITRERLIAAVSSILDPLDAKGTMDLYLDAITNLEGEIRLYAGMAEMHELGLLDIFDGGRDGAGRVHLTSNAKAYFEGACT